MKKIIIFVILYLSLFGCSNNINNQTISQEQDTLPKENKVLEQLDERASLPKGNCNNIEIKGVWKSIEDKDYSVIITDSLFIHHNVGADDDTLIYVLTDEMEGKKSTKFCYLIANERTSDVTYNYTVEVDKKTLSLTYLERGNLLVFTRQK
jgi:hypothetical protein